MKRVLLFVATNIAVLFVLTIVCQLLGVDVYLASTGQDFTGLLIFAALLGFGGSFISLWMSKWVAKRTTGAQVIDPQRPGGEVETWLVNTVRRQAEQAGIGMPEVAIYNAPEMNAFATGASRNKSLVAVSTGLLQQMSRDEVEAVLGHEVAHVANGDMVTMALLQGVL
ncbi:MAG: protease HtpX, partial [Lysobacterales bacterium]